MLTAVSLRCQVSIARKGEARGWRFTRNALLSKATSHENAEVDGNSEDSVIDDATEDYWAGSGSGPDEDDSSRNETREALTHEASDHDTVSHAPQLRFASHRARQFIVDFR